MYPIRRIFGDLLPPLLGEPSPAVLIGKPFEIGAVAGGAMLVVDLSAKNHRLSTKAQGSGNAVGRGRRQSGLLTGERVPKDEARLGDDQDFSNTFALTFGARLTITCS
jgi:hypothetical protein